MALPLHFRSATELARLLRARKVTASALLEDCLGQYKAHNKALNAVVVTDIPRAKKAAAAAFRARGMSVTTTAFSALLCAVYWPSQSSSRADAVNLRARSRRASSVAERKWSGSEGIENSCLTGA